MAATEVQQGIAKIYGMDSSSTAASMLIGAAAVVASGTMESLDIESAFDVEEIKGQNGEVETLIASNQTYSLTINFSPNGTGTASTRTKAIAEAAKFMAAPIVKVETKDFAVAAYNGVWNLMGWSGKKSRDGVFVMTMKLKAFITNRAALTAGVISG